MHISPGAAAPASPAFAGHDAFAQPAPRSHESCGLRATRVIFLNQPIVIIHEKGPCVDGLSPVPFCGRRSLRRPQISPLNATGTRENGFRHSYTRRGCRLVHHGAVANRPSAHDYALFRPVCKCNFFVWAAPKRWHFLYINSIANL